MIYHDSKLMRANTKGRASMDNKKISMVTIDNVDYVASIYKTQVVIEGRYEDEKHSVTVTYQIEKDTSDILLYKENDNLYLKLTRRYTNVVNTIDKMTLMIINTEISINAAGIISAKKVRLVEETKQVNVDSYPSLEESLIYVRDINIYDMAHEKGSIKDYANTILTVIKNVSKVRDHIDLLLKDELWVIHDDVPFLVNGVNGCNGGSLELSRESLINGTLFAVAKLSSIKIFARNKKEAIDLKFDDNVKGFK